MALFMGGGPHLNTWKEVPQLMSWLRLSKKLWLPSPGKFFSAIEQ
jgi:hypothetical protein